MLKLNAFALTETDKLNKFLETHVPYATADQGGIIINNGFVIVKYDDGVSNDNVTKKQILEKKIDENKGKLISLEIEQSLLDIQIKLIQPEGFKGDETLMQVKELYKKEGLKAGEADQMIGQMANFRSAHFTNGKEIERLTEMNKVMAEMVTKLIS